MARAVGHSEQAAIEPLVRALDLVGYAASGWRLCVNSMVDEYVIRAGGMMLLRPPGRQDRVMPEPAVPA